MSDEGIESAKIDPNQQIKSQQASEEVSRSSFLLFSYLYLIQGVVIGLIGTMPYIYPHLPDIETMALFNSISLPYSFKFLIAPFLQKFSLIKYGKRKTWIVISQLSAAGLLLLASFFTAETQAKTFAIICFFIQIFMVIQNIALHSLIIKEIPCPKQSSLIQSFAETLGILLGGLLLLKLTSEQFAKRAGLSERIAHPRTILVSFVLVIFVPIVLIHWLFKQKILDCERRGSKFTFCQIIKHYSIFLDHKTQYFRFCIIVLFYNQGLNFFGSLYDYKLVERGFSRDTSNTIGNIVIIPIILLTFYFGRWTQYLGSNRNAIMLCTSLACLICLYLLVVFPTDVVSISIITFISGILQSWKFYSFGVIINAFPLHALTGMFVTVLGSYFNFGRLTFVHTQLCGYFGWQLLSYIGLGIQVMTVMGSVKIFRWLQEGKASVGEQICEEKVDKEEYKDIL